MVLRCRVWSLVELQTKKKPEGTGQFWWNSSNPFSLERDGRHELRYIIRRKASDAERGKYILVFSAVSFWHCKLGEAGSSSSQVSCRVVLHLNLGVGEPFAMPTKAAFSMEYLWGFFWSVQNGWWTSLASCSDTSSPYPPFALTVVQSRQSTVHLPLNSCFIFFTDNVSNKLPFSAYSTHPVQLISCFFISAQSWEEQLHWLQGILNTLPLQGSVFNPLSLNSRIRP